MTPNHTTEEMTPLEQIQLLKAQAEEDIFDRLKLFTADTGCVPDKIEIRKVDTTSHDSDGTDYTLTGIKITVSLE